MSAPFWKGVLEGVPIDLKLVSFSRIVLAPLFITAQNTIDTNKEVNTEVNKTEVVLKKVDLISVNPKTQIKDLNFKKSKDLISVRAYIKSLQLKRKATLMS